ncbi:MAG: 30S ribosomal protein S16 [Patescibacteria group bacterium]|nr:30S ribosomal protein S16 [Patescibacteria group bacterium]
MIKIRLARYGNTNRQFYRVVAINQRSKTTGKCLEVLGTYNPTKPEVNINKSKVQEWIRKGAKLSETVSYLIQGGEKPKKSKNAKLAELKSKQEVNENKAQESNNNQN